MALLLLSASCRAQVEMESPILLPGQGTHGDGLEPRWGRAV